MKPIGEPTKNHFLIAAGICSALAAIAHLGCIAFGGDWYRFFGAGEQMALLDEQGSWYPTVVTSIIVFVLTFWSLYALSGAGLIIRLPFLRLVLCLISSIYLLRGLAFIGLMPLFPDNSLTFWIISSAICLGIGLLYAIGTYRAWKSLSKASQIRKN